MMGMKWSTTVRTPKRPAKFCPPPRNQTTPEVIAPFKTARRSLRRKYEEIALDTSTHAATPSSTSQRRALSAGAPPSTAVPPGAAL
jgi:hypothetical protein